MQAIKEIATGAGVDVTPWILRILGVRFSRRRYMVVEPFIYYCGDGKSGMTIHIPRWFIYDKASTPWWVWWWLPPDGEYGRGPVFHDFLYQSKVVSRFLADAIFRDIMRADGVGLVKRWVMWSAVRVGGWRSYNNTDGE